MKLVPPRSLLVVDDNLLTGELVVQLFKRLGWTTLYVHSGEEAERLLERGGFDLVLLDLRMPQMDGETVCRTYRMRFPDSRTPIVAFTAHRMPEERARLLDSGFSDLLVKPVSQGDVLDLCQRLGIAP